MISLAFDPGVNLAWAIVDVSPRARRATVLSRGMVRCESVADARRTTIRAWSQGYAPSVVAVERTHGIAFAGKKGIVANLVECGRVDGAIVSAALELTDGAPVPVLEVQATAWRRVVCGKPNASDAMIARVVSAWLGPDAPSTNEHTRDAIGLGIYAAIVASGTVAQRSA